jgi:hypothetical protein
MTETVEGCISVPVELNRLPHLLLSSVTIRSSGGGAALKLAVRHRTTEKGDETHFGVWHEIPGPTGPLVQSFLVPGSGAVTSLRRSPRWVARGRWDFASQLLGAEVGGHEGIEESAAAIAAAVD